MRAIERIKIIIDHYNIPVSRFEKKIGLANKTMVTAIDRKSSVKDDVLNSILEAYPDISAEWLLTGKGAMLKSKESFTKSVVQKIDEMHELLFKKSLENLVSKAKEVLDSHKTESKN